MIQTSQARVRQIDQWLEILDGVVLKHFEDPKCVHRFRMNIALGDSYTFLGREENKDEFNHTVELFFKGKVEDCIYGFVTNEGGSKVLPLSDKQENYIMTGKY